MKQIFTKLLAAAIFCALVAPSLMLAQGSQGQKFLLRVTSATGKVGEFKESVEGACDLLGAPDWGSNFPDGLCGEFVWAYDMTPDSLVCDSIVNDYTDKIVLIRRGSCEFGLKTLWAEKSGAKAVIITNHFANASEDDCTRINMGAGAVGAQVTIPVCFAPRSIGSQLDQLLSEGAAEACFLLPRTYDAAAAYHYATPVSQVDTLGNISMHFVNRTPDPIDNVVAKADIIAPNGSVTTLTVPVATVAPGQDTLITFPGYMPAAVKGEFNVVFSNNIYTESRDSLRRKFVHTDYTWSQATFVNDPGGVGDNWQDFQNGNFQYQVGGLCLTGDNPGAKATHVTFGISNIDSLYVPGATSGENDILVFVYDGDPDSNGEIDFGPNWTDMVGQQVAFGTYTMVGTEVDGQVVSTTLTDAVTGDAGVSLLPNHVYYVSLYYDGLVSGLGHCPRFMNSLQEYYLNFPTTPVYTANTMYSGWSGATTMHRLQLEGYDPIIDNVKTIRLDDSKVVIAPNPSNDLVKVDLNLDKNNKSVTVRLIDWTGRNVAYEIRRNFQNGRFEFETANLPSGMYMFWISTEEGTAVKKVAVCH